MFYNRYFKKGSKKDPGFQILYGPPFFETPILFIGYQPGKGCKTAKEERKYGSENRWPKKSEFATECWPLAVNLRNMFGGKLIENCVGTNAIFVRSNSISDYHKNLDKTLRKKIQEFCLCHIARMVKAIQPKLIVALGFATLELFDKNTERYKIGTKKRVLVRKGKICGQEAIGVLHLSGARISMRDRKTIARCIKSRARVSKG
ncbi:MAG: hypothetical protein WAL71_11625 [Terriglobales bacterium]